MADPTPIDFQQAVECLKTMIAKHVAKHGEAPPFVVVVGGTAMAARGIRAASFDVDFFSPVIDEDIVYSVEKELREIYGPDFKIDATPTENLWGPIIFRDLASSQQVMLVEVAGARVPIKALSSEDLILAKLAANRAKDRDDLPLLALDVDGRSLLDRFNTVVGWYGDRGSVMAFADRFLNFLEELKGLPSTEVIAALAVPDYIKDILQEARASDDIPDADTAGSKKPD